jgi:hypothetical protein
VPSSIVIFLEVGAPSRGGDFEGVGGSPGAATDVRFCFHTLRVSHEGNVKEFFVFISSS